MFGFVSYDEMCIKTLKLVWGFIPRSYDDSDFMVTPFNEFQPEKQDLWCEESLYVGKITSVTSL